MGILNATPDSFSESGRCPDISDVLKRAEEMLAAGAAILDVGGESTRPGAVPVAADEELRRTIPAVVEIRKRFPKALISIDTYKTQVAVEAVQAGAAIVNDVSGGRWDAGFLEAVAATKAGYVAMHSLDRPERMQVDPRYSDVVRDVFEFLQNLAATAGSLGLATERLAVDPGIGFGKTTEHNLELLRALDFWSRLRRPVVWGISRKSFISRIFNVEQNDRLPGSLAIHAWLMQSGLPQIWRVHEIVPYANLIETWFRLEKA